MKLEAVKEEWRGVKGVIEIGFKANELSISSLEIAELTNKRHDSVLRDIRNQLDEQDIGHHIFVDSYKSLQNKKLPCFRLDYDQTMILISGYSIPLRAKIIRRWTELENNSKPVLPQSFSEALQLAADQAKQLELQAPKVELADKCIRSSKNMSITDAGKHLGVRQKDMFEIMRDNQYLTVKRLPTQKALDRKVLTLKTNVDKNFKQSVMTMENIMNFQKRHL
jgi:phage antirepressor YoqD-like protein